MQGTKKKITGLHQATNIIMLSVHDEAALIQKAFRNGASGYVLKHSVFREVLNAIEHVNRGERYLGQEISDEIDLESLGQPDADGVINPLKVLTDRELEILFLISTGNTNTQIGANLVISEKTVEKHRSNLIKKLGIRSAAELTQLAIKYNLVILDE